MIIADKSADPYLLAHDLLAQAEHDEDAVAILLCTDETTAQTLPEVTIYRSLTAEPDRNFSNADDEFGDVLPVEER